jgi:hypothetical protein
MRRQTPTLAEREKAKAQALSHLQKTTDVTDWNCVGIEFVAETPNRVLLSI